MRISASSLVKDSTFTKIDNLSDSISKILESHPDSEFIVAGDFNKNKYIKLKDRSWFNKMCADAVRSKEEAFIECKSNPTPENELLRKEARNRCNAVLKQQQLLHDQKLRRKVLDYSKGSKNF